MIALIPARGGSVRIPRKNIKMFHGKPIIAYSIEVAQKTGLFDDIYVSTDDDEIALVAEAYGARVLRRGPELSVDTVGPVDIARHHFGGDADVCIIYATAPMLRGYDIARAHAMLRDIHYVVSVGVEPLHDAAQFIWCTRLRDCVPVFDVHTLMYAIPPETDCDINTPEDWTRAEAMYEALHATD